jgi:hypothetical protein
MPISGFSERKFIKYLKIAAFSGTADVSLFTVDKLTQRSSHFLSAIYAYFPFPFLLVAKNGSLTYSFTSINHFLRVEGRVEDTVGKGEGEGERKKG